MFSLITPILGGIFGAIAVIFIGILNVSVIKGIIGLRKEIAGANLTLEGIEEELEKNKIELRRLENDDRVECENIKGRNYVQLNYVEELKRLREYLELWHVVGMDEKRLLKYVEQEKIYTKLSDNFKTEEITTLKRILSRNKKRY